MQGVLYEEQSFWLFALVTCIMGGWAAWMTGRAIALTWRSPLQLVGYLLILSAVVRFIHFALFKGTLLSLQFYLIDFIVISLIGFIGWRYTLMQRMTSQYRWLYEQDGMLSWRARKPS
jgi:hypothetical protein